MQSDNKEQDSLYNIYTEKDQRAKRLKKKKVLDNEINENADSEIKKFKKASRKSKRRNIRRGSHSHLRDLTILANSGSIDEFEELYDELEEADDMY